MFFNTTYRLLLVTIEPGMVTKSEVNLLNGKYGFSIELSINSFFDEPWSLLGNKITFDIDSSTPLTMFKKNAKTWKWSIPEAPVKKNSTDFAAIHRSKMKAETRQLGKMSPDTMSSLSLRNLTGILVEIV